jgi:hypothetical protein
LARSKTKYSSNKARKPFPYWLILIGVGLILFVAWAILGSTGQGKAAIEVTGAPKIKVDKQAFDYGDVKLGGTPIRTVVRVTNVGDQDLKFTEAPYVEVLEGC